MSDDSWLAGRPQLGADCLCGPIQFVSVHGGRRVGEVQIRDTVHRHQVEVQMGHLEAGDHQPDPLGIKSSLDGRPDAAGDIEQVSRQVRWTVDPVVDLLDRHNQGVTVPEGIDGHEGDTTLVTPDDRSGNLAFDDPGEDGGHVGEG